MSLNKCLKVLFGIGFLVLLVVGLVSCRPAGEKTTTPPTAQAADSILKTAPAAKVSEPAAALPTAEPGGGKETSAVIVIAEDPLSFNAAVGDQGFDSLVMKMVLLGLTGIDPEGKVYPVLAAELPSIENGGVVTNADTGEMTVTWKLRQDVFWADGVPVTADDVVFTYDAITNPTTGTWINGIDYVTGVDKIDDHTFRMRFSSIYPGYLTLFGGEQVVIWPKHYCSAEQGFMAWDCGRKPLSNGPYILEDWVTGDHLTFSRNPKYFVSGKPLIDKIIVRIVPEASVRKTMLIQGDADVYMWATEQIVDELKSETNVKVSQSPTSRWVFRLFMNLAAKGSLDPIANPHPILADLRVRRAIRMALDVDTISKEIFRGYSAPVWTELFRAPYACNVPRPTYDPEAAKALLEEAGWTDTNGDGIRECHGCLHAAEGDPMKMELITYSEYGEPLILTQQLVGEMLKKIGMDLQLTVMQGSVLWADYQNGGIEQRGEFSIDLYDDGYGGIDPTDFLSQYYASASAEPDNGWNIGRWKNEEFDRLLGEAYTLDEQQRKDLFCQMAKILDDELPQILLFSAINADAYSARLAGVQSNINDLVTWNVADWTIVK